jgi:glycerol uptake facilitator-like aquaporin
VVYIVVQLVGATLAALLLKFVLPHAASTGIHVGAPTIDPSINAGKAVTIEAMLTFFLVWVIFATAVDPRGAFKSIAGLAIGLTITIDVLMGGPYTGAAMNPARAFGPELVGNFWGKGWVYWLGPIVGALIAGVAYEYLYLRPTQPPVVGTPESGIAEPRPGDTALS